MVNGKNKMWLMISFVVLLLILLVVFLIVGGPLGSVMWIIFGIIIANAVVVILISYLYSKKTGERIKGLSKPYQDTYILATNLVNVGITKNMERKEILAMILEIFEHADIAGRSVDEVIGNDINGYIQNFIEESKHKFNLLFVMTYSMFLYVCFLLFFKSYKVFRPGDFTIDKFKTETLDVGIVLMYTVISFVFYPLLMYVINQIAKNNLQGYKKLVIVIPASIPILLVGVLMFIRNESFRNFLDQPFVIFPNLFTFILGIVLGVVILFLMKYSYILKKKKMLK
ncbi:DUF1048 domain-containing protein [Candidatus Izimaplasma bacterium]|nr:DUF1048 domain-containing protein [Candidatus Izimaplasma bacterium]